MEGYENNFETDEVVGYGRRLSIRPPFQREFVYKPAQRNKVIISILKEFPLNVMYWIKSGKDVYGKDKFEMLDGQQRTISICEYIINNYSVKDNMISKQPKYFNNLTNYYQEKILNYNLLIYFCEGTDQEILDWFRIINIAGEKLTNQELRNAVYSGKWIYSAKKYFSKRGCPAYDVGHKYLKGRTIRQEYLQTVLKWISNNQIESYMSKHQHYKEASDLWNYFENVIKWVEKTFPNYDKLMQGADFGYLYNKYKDKQFDVGKLAVEIEKLLYDDEVSNKVGIWDYVISRDTKKLHLRSFLPSEKKLVYKNQKGICVKCKKHFKFGEMEADHIKPWSKGGKTTIDNCQLLCKHCNATKADNY